MVRRVLAPALALAVAAAVAGPARADAIDDPLAIEPPSRADGATVARIVAPTSVRARRDDPASASPLSTTTAWGHHAQELLVLEAAAGADGERWLRVLLPARPNGRSGWIRRDDALLSRTPYWVQIDVRRRTVSVFRRGRLARRTRAVVGASATPTPLGLSAVYERNRQRDPRAFLGPWALALTSHSDVLEDYGGGPGRVALHGRGRGSFGDPLGSARSHGCVRVDDEPIRWMAARLAPGTPVMVSR
ncbi:L,D-transpeptidase [Patulibacter defluvii]|uniref:L,D-transpeptidase n=1 Tax=Patulibacter defluvii TaxID=3095358 RepID=UPI002A7571B7|nr:L,D-transpeptidase [Patulibacter sp. DM4]